MGCSAPSPEEEAKTQAAQELQAETETGRLIAAKLIGKFGLDESVPTWVEYLNLVGGAIAERYGRPQVTFRFAILKSSEVNALAAPAGYIFVTRGLIDQLKDESELAAILGHEVGHVNEKHLFRQIAPKQKKSDAGFILARLLSRGAGDVGGAVQAAVNQGVSLLLEKGLDPRLESESDEAGLYYASGMGYDPAALGNFLSRMDRGSQKFPDTHPPSNLRLQALDRVIKRNQYEELYRAQLDRSKREVLRRQRFARYVTSAKGKPNP